LEEDIDGSDRRFYAARTGSLEEIYYNGSQWIITQINTNTYTVLARDQRPNVFYGARAGGGLDKLVKTEGAWATNPVKQNGTPVTKTYRAMVHESTAWNIAYAAGPDTLDYVYRDSTNYDSAYVPYAINNNAYTSLARASTTVFGQIYGARTNSLDKITHDTQWHTTQINTNTYTDLAPDGSTSGVLYAAGIGGLDWFQNDTCQGQINTNVYFDIEEAMNTNHLYGICTSLFPLTTPAMSNLSIQRNTIENPPGFGIYVMAGAADAFTESGVTINQNSIINAGSGSNPTCVIGVLVGGKTNNISIQANTFTDNRTSHVTQYCVQVLQCASDAAGIAVSGGHNVIIADGISIHHMLPYSPLPIGWTINTCTGNVINP
jgi:hypothetical protein